MSVKTITVPLWRAAHGRTGDKGNRSNISVIAWDEQLYEFLVEEITEAAVARLFAHRQPSQVRRYLLPQLHIMNFVLDDVLDGGVNDALNLDSHGKALSYLLLDMPLPRRPGGHACRGHAAHDPAPGAVRNHTGHTRREEGPGRPRRRD